MSDKLRNITTKDKYPKDQAITSQSYKTTSSMVPSFLTWLILLHCILISLGEALEVLDACRLHLFSGHSLLVYAKISQVLTLVAPWKILKTNEQWRSCMLNQSRHVFI
jgi:hypothetical protein